MELDELIEAGFDGSLVRGREEGFEGVDDGRCSGVLASAHGFGWPDEVEGAERGGRYCSGNDGDRGVCVIEGSGARSYLKIRSD